MSAVASQITGASIVCSGSDQRNAENVSIWWRHHTADEFLVSFIQWYAEDYFTVHVWPFQDIKGGRSKNIYMLLKLRAPKSTSFNVWVRYFVWNFKGTINLKFHTNILPIQWTISYTFWTPLRTNDINGIFNVPLNGGTLDAGVTLESTKLSFWATFSVTWRTIWWWTWKLKIICNL